ncbi:MAG: hypothetical protein PHG07_10780 [Lachnospiraceae bacterium]|nr:hypothetical protein [Lachnospiraceae bacterium]
MNNIEFKPEPLTPKDLFYSKTTPIECTETQLNLLDNDWMSYVLKAKLNTKKYGLITFKFSYCGTQTSYLTIWGEKEIRRECEYSTDLFEKYLIDFMHSHIYAWNGSYAYNGEKKVLDFYNDVLSACTWIS